jgi:signal transduction histidine kinase
VLTPKVLIVNDHPASLLALQSLLSGHPDQDYELAVARSGEEALRQVLTQEFAVILLDVNMPGMDGFETAEAIHSHPRSASVPIIFITAHHSDEMQRIKGYQHGAVDYLPIPVIPQILQTKVAVFVDLAKKKMQMQQQALEFAALNEELRTQRELDLRRIAECRAAEEALRQSQEELRQLASHQEQIKEDERKRIAREIHDELGQNLLALRIDISLLHNRTYGTHPHLHTRIHSMLEHIDATMKSLRSIINNLRPSVLDLGLHAAIEWQISEFERRTGIECVVEIGEEDYPLEEACATALFRILQESLNNVLRHAQASRVEVSLRIETDELQMRIADNGIGVYPGCRRKSNSFGLIGMKERVGALGGVITIETGRNMGMSLNIKIPLRAPTILPPEAQREQRALSLPDSFISLRSHEGLLDQLLSGGSA